VLSCRSLEIYIQTLSKPFLIDHSVSPHHDDLTGRKGHKDRVHSEHWL